MLLRTASSLLLLLILGCATAPAAASTETMPNILVILTDDQGYGDLGSQGNPDIRTPRLDAFAREAVKIDRFYVSPVCSPTRSSLLTGRWTYRTGVVDTFLGRSMMHDDERTIAELLVDTHRRGLFGKWHLGDNFPLRAMDQGFQRTLTLKGGGIGQPSDPPGGDHYQDPTLYRQGWPVKMKGYVTNLITDAALDFIREPGLPFFAWVAYNAPHTPLEVPDGYLQKYLDRGLSETTAKVYAMVENIDTNVGRLLDALHALTLTRDTIVVFLSDNGSQHSRYNVSLRGLKGTLFEGGIRSPFFIRWPAQLKGGRAIAGPAAHVDLLPTLLHACGLPKPSDLRLDGRSLLPALRGEETADRPIFLQWHRGEVPELRRSYAVVTKQWKLLGQQPKDPPLLFDLLQDPGEKENLAEVHREQVRELGAAYEAWFKDVAATRKFEAPRIHVGFEEENPTVLTRQDWRGPEAGWAKDSQGHWEIHSTRSLKLRVTLRFRPFPADGSALLLSGTQKTSAQIRAGQTSAVLDLTLRTGNSRLEALLSSGPQKFGPDQIELLRVD